MARFPFVKQLDSQDCGPACLRIVSKYHGRNFSADSLRSIAHVNRGGVSLYNLARAAEKIGYRTTSAKINFTQLQESELPCIVQWKQRHFIVVYKITGEKVFFADPAFGLSAISHRDFMDGWRITPDSHIGAVLVLSPTPFFFSTPDTEKKISFSFFLNYLRPFKSFYVQLYLGMGASMVLALLMPFMTQSLVDIGINNQNIEFIQLILAAQLMLAFSSTVIGLIRSWIFLHMGSRVSIAVISDYLIKLMKLPLSFFDTKSIGDIMQRMGDHSRIQGFISATTLNTLFSFLNFIVFGAIMAYYNMNILVVFLFGSSLYAIWVILFMKKRKEFDYLLFAQSSARQTTLVQLISGIRDIKLHAIEQQKRWEWERLQVKGFKINVRQLTLGQYQQVGGFFIDQSKNIIISFMAAKSVIDGDMTLGMMMSLQFILGQLNSPVSQFIGLINTYQDAKISFERINEVHDKPDEDNGQSKIVVAPEEMAISIENLSFSYSGAGGKKVIDNLTLNIPHGKITAIVGASGSGKTTLLKLLLKFYDGYEGKIKIGNVDLKKIGHQDWRKNCGVVMQDGFIFSDSIAANIALGEETPDLERLHVAATMANIADFIEEQVNGYDSKIGAEGIGLSQGQKQRILIARALYRNPNLLLFDEATNSLDTRNESEIVRKLDKFLSGKTAIVIAHRLSTVKNADQIVVLNMGKVIEVGDHNILVKKKGAYYELVRNQLELEK